MNRSLRGATAVAGIGATPYYKRGTSPHSALRLILEAILAACADAGLDAHDVDGFVSYASDLNEGLAVGAALGVREVRWSTMVWGGGGGGVAAAVNAAAGGGGLRAGRERDRVPRDHRGRRRAAELRQGSLPAVAFGPRGADPGPGLRAADPADARGRRGAVVSAGGPGSGVLLPRAAEPGRRGLRAPAGSRDLRRVAVGLRAAAPVRLLPRERRRRGRAGHLG